MLTPRTWLTLAVGVSLLAVAVVVWQELDASTEGSAWTALDRARRSGDSIEEVERVRELCVGTSAEPWSSLELALALYRSGQPADIERGVQVARAASVEFQGEPVGKLLTEILAVLSTYSQG